MNSAQPPEDGPWDATRGPHQQATDPGRQAGQGRCCSQNALSELSLVFPLHLCAGWEIGGSQIKPTLHMAISDPAVGTDKNCR